ncbi:hypothetical protein CSA56_02900 [candidate division KSB3 bacterium]|uniref:Uncharacterized protein n=1 Tax=candidate division KSB3 bacterium TaxID=2044937 RepID=A0A2G6KJC6_9BACT|nr:MAG: hypothetical protein CSA56_02900 [candidate division KSB3 bacterium]
MHSRDLVIIRRPHVENVFIYTNKTGKAYFVKQDGGSKTKKRKGRKIPVNPIRWMKTGSSRVLLPYLFLFSS